MSDRSLHVGDEVPSCPTPRARRKYRHRLWVCDCGRAYRSRSHFTYGGIIRKWEEWKPNA